MTVPRHASGFTLIELMIVVAILAIVTVIGVPSFTTMIKNNRLTASVNDLAGGLSYARAEAVRRGRAVRVDNTVANDLSRVRIWFDADADNSFDNDGSEELRLVHLSAASGLALAVDSDGTPKTNISLSYSPRGTVSGGGNQLKLTLCDDRTGSYGKEISLLASGVLRTTSGITCS